MSQSKAHILVFPFPAQGHMIPLLDFTLQLSNRGLKITILVTPKNLPLLTPLLSRNPSIQTLVLPFPTHPSIPSGVENVKDLPATGFRHMIYALTQLRDPVIQWFKAHPSPPTAIIFDVFLGWTNSLASQLGIPGYVFSPSGVLALSLVDFLWRDFPKRSNPNDVNEMVCFSKVPNRPSYPWCQISTVYRSYVENESSPNPISDATKANFLGNMNSSGWVINTVTELEKVYLDHFKEISGHDRVWAVGPVLPPGDTDQAERGGAGTILSSEVVQWLDNVKVHKSVVYVCFGSQAVLSNEQMEALTMGLEKSGVGFILSIKGATKGHDDVEKYGVIPSGFEERVAGRGLVIKGWAPQVLILRHPCVGAFLTHCGWNSVLEGINAGVPMLAWPMSADQFGNATLIIDEMKVGRRVCEGAVTVPDSDEMAANLAEAVGGFGEERRRALELQKAAMDAVREGGSSCNNLASLVLHLSIMQAPCPQ